MSVFVTFLAAVAVLWLGLELVQPQSAFLSFVVLGLAVWVFIETAMEAGRALFDIVSRR